MSENVHYSTVVMDGGAGSLVRRALRKRGVIFHDDAAWLTARQRTDDLEKLYRQKLEALRNQCPGEKISADAPEEVQKLDSMLSAFCRVPAFKAFAEQKYGEYMNELCTRTSNLHSAHSSGRNNHEIQQSARAVQHELEHLAASIQKELCGVEKEAVTNIVSADLNRLGYLVEKKGDALRATLGQNCVWAQANQFGELSIDLSGFSGFACMKEMARLEGQFTKSGLILKRTLSQYHGRPEGAVLVQKLKSGFPEFKRIHSKSARYRGHSQNNNVREKCKL